MFYLISAGPANHSHCIVHSAIVVLIAREVAIQSDCPPEERGTGRAARSVEMVAVRGRSADRANPIRAGLLILPL